MERLSLKVIFWKTLWKYKMREWGIPHQRSEPQTQGSETGRVLKAGGAIPAGNSPYTGKAAKSPCDFPVWTDQPRPQLNQTNKLTKFISDFMFKPSPAPDD